MLPAASRVWAGEAGNDAPRAVQHPVSGLSIMRGKKCRKRARKITGNRGHDWGGKNTHPQSCSWPLRAPRVALKPQSPATPWYGGTALCPAAAWPLTCSLPRIWDSGRSKGPGGMWTPGVLEQPKDPRGVAWALLPAPVCQLQGQCCMPGASSLPLPQFPHLFFPARAFQKIWCPEDDQVCGQRRRGTEAGAGRDLRYGWQLSVRLTHAHFPFWQQTPSWGRCRGLAALRSCCTCPSQDESVGASARLVSWFQSGGTLARLRAGFLHPSQQRQGFQCHTCTRASCWLLPWPCRDTGGAGGCARLGSIPPALQWAAANAEEAPGISARQMSVSLFSYCWVTSERAACARGMQPEDTHPVTGYLPRHPGAAPSCGSAGAHAVQGKCREGAVPAAAWQEGPTAGPGRGKTTEKRKPSSAPAQQQQCQGTRTQASRRAPRPSLVSLSSAPMPMAGRGAEEQGNPSTAREVVLTGASVNRAREWWAEGPEALVCNAGSRETFPIPPCLGCQVFPQPKLSLCVFAEGQRQGRGFSQSCSSWGGRAGHHFSEGSKTVEEWAQPWPAAGLAPHVFAEVTWKRKAPWVPNAGGCMWVLSPMSGTGTPAACGAQAASSQVVGAPCALGGWGEHPKPEESPQPGGSPAITAGGCWSKGALLRQDTPVGGSDFSVIPGKHGSQLGPCCGVIQAGPGMFPIIALWCVALSCKLPGTRWHSRLDPGKQEVWSWDRGSLSVGKLGTRESTKD